MFLFNCFRYRFTQIAVDPQIKTPGGKTYDVIFVGTGKRFREKKDREMETLLMFAKI